MERTESILNDFVFEEGFKTKVYTCTAGKMTIGIGHNLEASGIDEDLLIEQFWRDLERVERGLKLLFARYDNFTDARKLALLQMAFQLGIDGVKKFNKMCVAINAGDWDNAAKEALQSKWASQTPARAHRMASRLITG